MRKILVVNMNYIGDVLMTTPALAALRRAYPDARIDTVVGAGPAADVLSGNPDLNQIIARTARGSWGRCMQIYRLLRENRYTDAIILPPLPAYALAAFAARTPVRMGLANHGMNRFLTDLMPTDGVHMADRMRDTVGASCDDKEDDCERRLTVIVEADALAYAETLLRSTGLDLNRPIVAVNLGATRPQKRWFSESFAGLIDELGDIQTVLIGAGDDDNALAETVLGAVKGNKPASIVGKTSVKQLAGVLRFCTVVVSADSGPMHIATAVGTPVVALFGSTDPTVTGPYDRVSRAIYKALPCAPCFNHPTCNGRFDCLRAITPAEVATNVREILSELRATAHSEPLMAVPATVETKSGDASAAAKNTVAKAGPSSTRYKRILIVTKFRFIGDTLLAVPIFRAARAQWPEARIVLLTGKNARVLLQNNPYLDEIIEFDPYKKDSGQAAFWQLVRRIRRSRFDLCLALNRSFHSALLPWLGGIGTRAGFESEGRGALLNRRVDYDRDKSEIACYFDVLSAVAPETDVNPSLELWISPAERRTAWERIARALDDESEHWLVGIQPGASLDGKRWPATRFAAVADALVASDTRVRIVLVGGNEEKPAADEMVAACADRTRSRLVSFVGACDLRGSLGIISFLQMFIGNDTAVMHSAVALGVRTVALFGPTNPRKWGNYGDRHRVVESVDGSMDGIAVDLVAARARELLDPAI